MPLLYEHENINRTTLNVESFGCAKLLMNELQIFNFGQIFLPPGCFVTPTVTFYEENRKSFKSLFNAHCHTQKASVNKYT